VSHETHGHDQGQDLDPQTLGALLESWLTRDVDGAGDIHRRWRAEGRQYRPSDVVAEIDRQAAWKHRARQDQHLALCQRGPDCDFCAQINDWRRFGAWCVGFTDAPAPHEPVWPPATQPASMT
jgi:hypothetical protein